MIGFFPTGVTYAKGAKYCSRAQRSGIAKGLSGNLFCHLVTSLSLYVCTD